MNFFDYINLIRRHLLMTLVIVLIVALTATFFVQYKNNKPYETTIFVSIGNQDVTNIFDSVQASDYFSETVQGWFKNPEFISRLNSKANTQTDVSARKQEKQNILVTFYTANTDEGVKIASIIKDELSKEIQTYDQKTNNKFQIAILSVYTEQKPLSLPLFLIIAVICGTVLASFVLYGYEYLFGKIVRK